MTSDQAWTKLQHLLNQDLALAEQNIMIKELDHYKVFGCFEIWPKANTVQIKKYGNPIQDFASMKSAISWCIAEKYQQLKLSREIAMLDKDRSRLTQDLSASNSMLQQVKDLGRREILRVKIDAKRLYLKSVEDRLSKCVNYAKYCQIRGFNDEIARTRRPTPHRTSRFSAAKPVWQKS
jgi:hypothetical protein